MSGRDFRGYSKSPSRNSPGQTEGHTKAETCIRFSRIYLVTGVHEFSKNIGVISNFYAPEGWHGARCILGTRSCGVTYQRHC